MSTSEPLSCLHEGQRARVLSILESGAMRRRLRRRGIEHLPVCISAELPRGVPPDEAGGHTPASIAFVPPSAGLTLAAEAVRILLEREADSHAGERNHHRD